MFAVVMALSAVGCEAIRAKEGETCKTDESCASGLRCIEHRCWSDAAFAEHCRERCRENGDGRCSVQVDRCVIANDADCAAATACAEEGSCHYRYAVGEPRVCFARDDADCAPSRGCRERGQCHAIDGRCVKQ